MSVHGSWTSDTLVNDLELAVSLEEFKNNRRLDLSDTSEDPFIKICIGAAVELVEQFTNRALITRNFTWVMDCYPGSVLYIPMAPVTVVNSFKYYDQTTEVLTTWDSSNYTVDISNHPARIVKNYTVTYPTLQKVANAVEIKFTAGYGDDFRKVPTDLKMCVMYLAGNFFEHREPVVAGTALIVTEIPLTYRTLLLKNRIFHEV